MGEGKGGNMGRSAKTKPFERVKWKSATGEVELVSNWRLHAPRLVFTVLEGTLDATRGERQAPAQLQILSSTVVSSLQDTLVS